MDNQVIHTIDALEDLDTLKSLASEQRIRILAALRAGSANVNELALELGLPQSTVATNVLILERAGLIRTETLPAKKGSQKVCHGLYQEVVVRIPGARPTEEELAEVEMPIGLYTAFEASPPCGLCSPESIIGFMDSSDAFLAPERMKAGLLWLERGWIEYQFPNKGLYRPRPAERLELRAELSANAGFSEICVWVNNVELGAWTSVAGDENGPGKLTPSWLGLEGPRHGSLKSWIVSSEASFVDGVRVSGARIGDLGLDQRQPIKVRIGLREGQASGGLRIFGRGFGNYDSGIVLRLGF